MKGKLLAVTLVVLSILIASCAPAATPTPEVVEVEKTRVVKETQVVVVTATPGAPIKIGLSVGVTGLYTYIYWNETEQVRMAADEINAAGGVLGRPLEIVLMDDASDPKQGVIAAHTLCDMPEVVAVLGHAHSGVLIPAAEVYHECGMPVITHGSSPKITELGFDNIFQNGPNDAFHGIAMATQAHDLGVRSVSIIHEKTMWGERLAQEFKAKAEDLGIKVLSFQGIAETDVDFSPVLTKIKDEDPDAIFTACGAPSALLRKQMKALGMELLDFGAELVGAEYVNTVGDAGVGAYTSVGSPVLGLTEELRAMAERLKARVGQEPEPFGLKFYEGVYVFADAIERAGSADREAILKALPETDMVGPVTGWRLAWDKWGRMKEPVAYLFQMTSPGVLELVEEVRGTYPPQD